MQHTYDKMLGAPHNGIASDAKVCRSRATTGEEDRASLHSGECVRQGEKWIASRWLQEQPTCGFDDELFVEE